jgi:hypothetical protein
MLNVSKWKVAVAAGLLLAAFLVLPLTVRKRVVFINLDGIFPTLSDTYKSGTQLKYGAYPCAYAGPNAYYYIRTTNGSVRLEIELTDYSRLPYFRQYRVGSPSQPIGEESFYEIAHPSRSEDLMDLAYQRHNLTAFFRQEPIHGIPDKPYAYSDEDRKRVEQLCITLDQALAQPSPAVTIENVHLYQVLLHELRRRIGGLWFTIWVFIYHLLGKDIHF